MQIRLVLGTTVGAALLASTGCMVDRTYAPGEQASVDQGRFVAADNNNGFLNEGGGDVAVDEQPDVDLEGLFTGARDGHMRGDVGPATGINQAPQRLNAYDDGWYLSVESAAQLDDRAAMLMLSASNASDLFVPGMSGTFSLYEYEADGPQVTLLGCTGGSMDMYDEYDVPADEVDVVVEEGEQPGEVVVQVAGRWNAQVEYDYDGNVVSSGGDVTVASASFTLTR